MPKRMVNTNLSESPSKRRKNCETEDSKFNCGAICSVQLINFMTHERLSLTPGHRVNLITGKNGSGKSAILQAIVLGLGE